MREILFRGKRVEEPIKIKHYAPDGWVYGDLITCDDGHFILPHDISGEMYIDRPYKFRANDVEARVMLAKVGENTTSQYAGLTDKNGTKIFEGDIVKLNNQIGSVVYENGCFGIGCKDYINYRELGKLAKKKTGNFSSRINIDNFIALLEIYFNFNDIDNYIEEIEIIGNIYDNPELLTHQHEDKGE